MGILDPLGSRAALRNVARRDSVIRKDAADMRVDERVEMFTDLDRLVWRPWNTTLVVHLHLPAVLLPRSLVVAEPQQMADLRDHDWMPVQLRGAAQHACERGQIGRLEEGEQLARRERRLLREQ